MEKNNLTVWQRLTQTFGPNSLLNQDYPTYKFDKTELLKTTSKQEYEKEKLQAQQTVYLSNQWTKIESNLYTQAVYYEPTRLASFYDYESMEFCIAGDTKIATPDGFITIKELADKGRDNEFITYAYDHNLKKVVPAMARNAHYTRDEMTYKVTFDDGSFIITTWEHQLMKRDGSFERVMNLKPGDSMMPFYRKSFYNNKKYNWLYTCNSNEGNDGWVSESKLISEWSFENERKKYNEILNNLEFKIPFDNIIENARIFKTIEKTSDSLNVPVFVIENEIINSGYKNWEVFLETYGIEKTPSIEVNDEIVINHKIVSIEPHEVIPVYDLTVPGYKNFATDTIFSHNTPEISAALDIYAEECTTVDQNGHMLQIYSESKRIKSILVDLFNNVLDINTSLPMWTRNACKYGDNFVYLKLDSEKGVVGCMQLPNIEMERFERGMIAKTITTDEPSEHKGLRFKWKAKDMEFNTWEIAHFRLLGDDRKLPYGTSILEKARRIWKQLMLAEDAMLIYRTSRAPERRVFKVFVGNMDDNDVEAYVQRVANKFKRDQVVDSKTGNVDMRFNQMAVDQDYFIPVRDPAAPNPIDTLPGAQNLGEIADIEYIQKKLLTALRVPKAFLGFEEPVGGGKDLSLMDIRFARTINKVQKCMISELNKIAIIHLFLLGFEDELRNFTLTLTNPSSQSDLLKIDVWKEKLLVYKDAVSPVPGSLAPVSASWAKKHILGFSDEEIKLDLQQQRIERAVEAELTNTPTVITKTGLFDNIDKLYGTKSGATQNVTSTPPPAPGAPPMGEPLMPPAPEPAPGLTPEDVKKDNLNILIENYNLIDETSFIDLSKGKNSLGEMTEKLNRLIND